MTELKIGRADYVKPEAHLTVEAQDAIAKHGIDAAGSARDVAQALVGDHPIMGMLTMDDSLCVSYRVGPGRVKVAEYKLVAVREESW